MERHRLPGIQSEAACVGEHVATGNYAATHKTHKGLHWVIAP